MTLTDWQEQVYAQLDRTWKRLDEIAAGMGRELSGSGYQNACDALVEAGYAEVKREMHAPMGRVYRRVL